MGLLADHGQKDTLLERLERSLEWSLGADYGAPVLENSNDKARHDRLNHRLVAEQMRRQQNIETIIAMAYRKAESGPEIQNDAASVHDDWMAHFLDFSGMIGDEDMQAVWADVLVRETAGPGQFSYGTLQKLSTLTPQQMDLCRRLVRLSFPTGLLFKLARPVDMDAFGLLSEHIEQLKNLDLLWKDDDLNVSFLAPSKGLTLDFTGADLVFRHPERELFTFHVYKLTDAGRELTLLMQDGPVDPDYLKALGLFMKSEGYDFRLKIKNEE